jgi:hypothetical protein
MLFKTLTALKSCLHECGRTSNPLRALDEFVDRLRVDPSWHDSEVREVESAAHRILQAQPPNKKP